MGWNRKIFANLGELSGVVLSAFIGMALVSCAGTDSSMQTKVDDNPNLFKLGTPIADTLASRMPEFAHSVFKGAIDSVPGEYYYYATNGRIDSLIQKDGEQYKAVASITYDSLNGQNNYELKKGARSYRVNDGILDVEDEFPRYAKTYWGNGNPRAILTGFLYRDNQGVIKMDSGHSETYFENGKIKQQNEWKNKQGIASKLWNENGVLVVELDFPKYFKKYWDNGKQKEFLTGLLYRDAQGIFRVDSGWSEIYSESGKLLDQKKWEDKQVVVCRQWNEDGVMIKDIDFPKSFKEYWNNGKIKGIGTGLLYRDNQGTFLVDSGHSELYFENGKLKQENDWKNKQLVAQKEWNEKGALIREFDFPKHLKEYYDNGKIKKEMTGLYFSSPTNVEVDNGYAKEYYENGRMMQHSIYKEKLLYSYKEWRENGTLIHDWDISKGYLKQYNENGTIRLEMKGYTGKKDNAIENGYFKMYSNNGKLQLQEQYKDKKSIAKKAWNEKGKLVYELVFPNYEKIYSDNGNLHNEKKGTLYYDDQNEIQIQDGSWKIYHKNGKPGIHQNYKEKKLIGQKVWYENGTLKNEGDVSKGFHKEYYPNGKVAKDVSGKFHYNGKDVILENGTERLWDKNGNLKIERVFPKYEKLYFDDGSLFVEAVGTLYYDEQNKIRVQDGFVKQYCENQTPSQQKNYKDKKLVGKKVWNESGIVTISVELPNRYREFYDDGKIKAEVTGTIVEENNAFRIKDGVYNMYDVNGKITNSATYRNFQVISDKNNP